LVGTASAIAFQDLRGSLGQLPLALQLALDDINGKYRRTALGPLWIVIGQLASIVGFLVVFSVLFRMDPHSYALYLAAGLPVWMLISSFLTDMPQVFVNARGFIESFELPWLMHVWRKSIGNVIMFLHQILTLFLVMALVQQPPTWQMLLVAPALLVVTVAGSGVGMILGVLGARYRDLGPTMGIVTRFAFFFSAVMWRPEQLDQNMWIVHFNPLFYFIHLVREPLLGQAPSLNIWLGTSAVALALLAGGFIAFYVSRKRLYHWL
jgi:ABC-type polysaccharide/polyol phosphate export permease